MPFVVCERPPPFRTSGTLVAQDRTNVPFVRIRRSSPRGWGAEGAVRPYGSFQSTGSPPSSSSSALTRLNGFDPKKPRSADMGDGCADST